jgi:uncharacterized protein YbaP (TraB family)
MKLLFLVLILIFKPALAQNPDPAVVNKSVWVWKLTGESKDVYFLGELHSFVGKIDMRIDYSVGEKFINSSSDIWIESVQSNTDVAEAKSPLFEKISGVTLDGLEKIVNASIETIASEATEKKRAELKINFLKTLNKSEPVEAYSSLASLNLLVKRKNSPLVYASHRGLRRNIENKKSDNVRKFIEIEKNNSVASAWYKKCGDFEANTLIASALNFNNTELTLSEKLQKIFLDSNSNLDDIKLLFDTEIDGKILEKCVISPRNIEWFPKILKAIQTPGKPAVFLLGIGHFSGDNGLLNLLRQSGYHNIERLH